MPESPWNDEVSGADRMRYLALDGPHKVRRNWRAKTRLLVVVLTLWLLAGLVFAGCMAVFFRINP